MSFELRLMPRLGRTRTRTQYPRLLVGLIYDFLAVVEETAPQALKKLSTRVGIQPGNWSQKYD